MSRQRTTNSTLRIPRSAPKCRLPSWEPGVIARKHRRPSLQHVPHLTFVSEFKQLLHMVDTDPRQLAFSTMMLM